MLSPGRLDPTVRSRAQLTTFDIQVICALSTQRVTLPVSMELSRNQHCCSLMQRSWAWRVLMHPLAMINQAGKPRHPLDA